VGPDEQTLGGGGKREVGSSKSFGPEGRGAREIRKSSKKVGAKRPFQIGRGVAKKKANFLNRYKSKHQKLWVSCLHVDESDRVRVLVPK